MKRIFYLLWIFFGALLLTDCNIQGAISNTLTLTNVITPEVPITNSLTVIEWNTYTNHSVVTNEVQLTNDGYVIAGNIYITNVQNEQTVQPTFFISGTMDGDLIDYIADGDASIFVQVTNSGYLTNGSVWTDGDEKLWEAVVFSHNAYPYIHVKVQTELQGFGSYSMSMNFRLSNLPAYAWNEEYSGIVTNADQIDLSGQTWAVNPDNVSLIELFRINESGVTNSVSPPSLVSVSGWTNTVNARDFDFSNVALDNGQNTFFGTITSTYAVSSAISSFSITRALFGIDGILDANWMAAPMVAQSTAAGTSGYQLGELRITNDNAKIYFWVENLSLPEIVSENNGPRIALSIDTNSAAGCFIDAWGGNFAFTNVNGWDYQLQCRISSSGGQALYAATGSNETSNIANNWSDLGLQGIEMAVISTNGFEFSVPMSLLSISSGDSISAVVSLSGLDGDSGNAQAWDIIPEDALNTTSANENDTNATSIGAYAPVYTVH